MVDSLDTEITLADANYTTTGNRITNYIKKEDVEFKSIVFEDVCIETFLCGSKSDIDGAVVISHGSAFVRRSMDVFMPTLERLAKSLPNIIIIVPDYRTIPINTYTDSINDLITGIRYANSLGFSNDKIVMYGDSSGAHTAISACLDMRDCGIKKLAGLVLTSPYLNFKRNTESYSEKRYSDCTTTYELLDYIHTKFEETGINPAKEDKMLPLSRDLSKLPNVYVQVGTDEVVYDDTIELARKLFQYGVNATVTVYENMYHNFQFCTSLNTSKYSWNNIVNYIKLRIHKKFSRYKENDYVQASN